MWVVLCCLYFFQVQAEERGITKQEASFLLSVIGIANLVGRIILGYISDKPWINRLHVYNVCLTICGVGEYIIFFIEIKLYWGIWLVLWCLKVFHYFYGMLRYLTIVMEYYVI
jgi:predicted MFS family arabinose efflux permease